MSKRVEFKTDIANLRINYNEVGYAIVTTCNYCVVLLNSNLDVVGMWDVILVCCVTTAHQQVCT